MDDLPTLDAHAHVWDRRCAFVAGARYRPDYEATVEEYLRLLDRHGVERAVLVQPSFLGTDNGYLLAALRGYPDRLRGIAVVDPDIAEGELDDMSADGVVGLRYNLLSLAPERLATNPYRDLTERAADRRWWIEVQAHGPDWPGVLAVLGDVPLMIDHFGRPGATDCPGFAAILARAPDRTLMKLSAPYRQAAPDMATFARRLLDHFGPARCLWGSDWPWTQHESQHSYAHSRSWLSDWTTAADRQAMLTAAPCLTGFR